MALRTLKQLKTRASWGRDSSSSSIAWLPDLYRLDGGCGSTLVELMDDDGFGLLRNGVTWRVHGVTT
ncbi:hypothetical protein V6N11_007999 [Hibiscus sabdariffa]|uniref:Uncharacterized protein n=1 Tax=Hibiscus sabdariffa TaxID=183260 RepID=A0ABR2PZU3_9ROSI